MQWLAQTLGKIGRLWLSSWRLNSDDEKSKTAVLHNASDSRGLGKLFAMLNASFSSGATGIMLLATVLTTAMAGASIVYDTILDDNSPLQISSPDLDHGVVVDEHGNYIVPVDEHGNILTSSSNVLDFGDILELIVILWT